MVMTIIADVFCSWDLTKLGTCQVSLNVMGRVENVPRFEDPGGVVSAVKVFGAVCLVTVSREWFATGSIMMSVLRANLSTSDQ